MTLVPVAALLAALASEPAQTRIILNRRLEPGQTVATALRAAGLSESQLEGVISALTGAFDFRRARAGDQLRLVLSGERLEFFDYRQSALDEWSVRREGDKLLGLKREIPVERTVARVELSVDSSLYESAIAAGEDPSIAMALADVFAWDIDFYQDVRRGDRAVALVEKVVSKGRLLRYGEVLAAEYRGSAVGDKEVYRYELPKGGASYFQRDGSSARKSFLRSPLKYAHITSRFGNRLHPLLGFVKAHQGVDYGTPVGTPVWAVADGTVTRATYDDAAGRHLCVRHMNGFESCYLHLSRFGAGVRAGARVAQKQIIAYSGNTGRSTGPHLHFALKRGGKFVNPLAQTFPRADPLPKSLLDDFRDRVAPWATLLHALPVAAVAAPKAAQ